MLKLFYLESEHILLKICMTVQAPISQIFLQYILWNHSQFKIMYMIIYRLRWCQHATLGKINFHGYFDYSSFSFCILYHYNIQQKCKYVYQMSLEYFSIFLSRQGQQIITVEHQRSSSIRDYLHQLSDQRITM